MKKYIIAIISLAFLYSCEDVIDVDFNPEDVDVYIIDAKISNIEEPLVYFGNIVPITEDTLYNGINNATITISDDEEPANVVTLVENSEYGGFYHVALNDDYFGVAGRTYTITIETEDGAIITGSETLFPVEPIDSIDIWPSERGNEQFLGIFTFGQETPGVGNYYKWDIYINGKFYNDPASMAFADDGLVDGNYVQGLEIFTDFHNPSDKSERKLNVNDTIVVHQTSISKFGFDYYYQLVNQANAGFLFSLPSANLPTNLSSNNGKEVYGAFIAQDKSISNSVIITEELDDQLAK